MLYTKLKHKTKELKEFVSMGIVDPHWLRDIHIFERFHGLEPDFKCKMCRYEIIAEEFDISSDHVRKVVATMTG